MTAPTPEQMRALAVEAESETCRARYTAKEAKSLALEQAAALRAAADQLEAVQAELEDVRGGYQMSSATLDRFRDVVCEATGFDKANPGDDVALKTLRERVGLAGPEPTRWRDFVTGARAQVDQINAERRPIADTAPQDAGVTTDGIYGVTHFPIKEWTENSDD